MQTYCQNSVNFVAAFGSAMPTRAWTDVSRGYRYGFNGMEKDDEVKGEGNSYDFGARILDSRLGRWLSLDPLMMKYPSVSDYCFAGNNPIAFIDIDGEKILLTHLSRAEKKEYKAMIKTLKKSAIFKQMYKDLKRSKGKIYIRFGEKYSGGGSYGKIKGQNTVTFDPTRIAVLAQELFHSYQDIPENADLNKGTAAEQEIEGELATFYIMNEVYKETGNENHVYSPIGGVRLDNPDPEEGKYEEDVFNDYAPPQKEGVNEWEKVRPSSEEVSSDEFNESYQKFKPKFRANLLKQEENPFSKKYPPHYKGPTSDTKPEALTRLIKRTDKKK